MRITLTETQERASEEILAQVTSNLDKKSTDDVVFYAPTASGKTVMMAMTIRKLIKKYKGDIAFLWLSIGTGELHLQSLQSLEMCIGNTVTCGLLERGKASINKNEVAVINWERINRRGNTFLEEGDYVNFFTICGNTKESCRLCLIIDESHKNSNTEIGRALKDKINPDSVVNISATPTSRPTVVITHEEMVRERVVKRHAVVNEGVEDYMKKHREVDKFHAVLAVSYLKRIELKDYYVHEGLNVNPLCIVQVPNKEKGDARINAIKMFYAEKGITEENGKLAVWITNRKGATISATAGFDKDRLKDNDNRIEVLIFKQAIDTGWNCPRAQIWIKLREITSAVFSRQTLGRVMRTVYREYYEQEDLNLAFAYTDGTFEVVLDDLDPFIIDWQHAELKEDVDNIVLDKHHKKWDNRALKGTFNKSLNTVFCEELNMVPKEIERNKRRLTDLGFNLSTERTTSKISKEKIIDMVELETNQVQFENSELEGFDARENLEERLEDLIETTLSECKIARNSVKKARGSLLFWASECIGYVHGVNVDGMLSFFIRNWTKFDYYMKKAVSKYMSYRILERNKDQLKREDWSMPGFEYYGNSYDEVPHRHYAYEPCYLRKDRSKPEKAFEKFIDFRDDVEWWVKNRDYGHDYFSVPYRKRNGERHAFYIDYVVKFKNGFVGLFDPKGGTHAEGYDVEEKAKGLYEYIEKWNSSDKGFKLFGGILCQNRVGLWKICQSYEYRYDSMLDHWDDFREILDEPTMSTRLS